MLRLAHQGPAQFAIRQLCDTLDEDLEALNREERFVVFSGLVSPTPQAVRVAFTWV